MPATRMTGGTDSVFKIERTANPERIFINTCAFISVIIYDPNILKIAGIAQYIPPSGKPKSRKFALHSICKPLPMINKYMLYTEGYK